MSTHVVGIKPPDEKWRQMKAVYDACIEAEVEIPEEVREFFEHDTPDDAGVVIDLDDDYAPSPAVSKWSDGKERSGFEVKLEELPEGIKIIRFYNAW
jgi:hypothetical protein